jgi:hypothetical protein
MAERIFLLHSKGGLFFLAGRDTDMERRTIRTRVGPREETQSPARPYCNRGPAGSASEAGPNVEAPSIVSLAGLVIVDAFDRSPDKAPTTRK